MEDDIEESSVDDQGDGGGESAAGREAMNVESTRADTHLPPVENTAVRKQTHQNDTRIDDLHAGSSTAQTENTLHHGTEPGQNETPAKVRKSNSTSEKTAPTETASYENGGRELVCRNGTDSPEIQQISENVADQQQVSKSGIIITDVRSLYTERDTTQKNENTANSMLESSSELTPTIKSSDSVREDILWIQVQYLREKFPDGDPNVWYDRLERANDVLAETEVIETELKSKIGENGSSSIQETGADDDGGMDFDETAAVAALLADVDTEKKQSVDEVVKMVHQIRSAFPTASFEICFLRLIRCVNLEEEANRLAEEFSIPEASAVVSNDNNQANVDGDDQPGPSTRDNRKPPSPGPGFSEFLQRDQREAVEHVLQMFSDCDPYYVVKQIAESDVQVAELVDRMTSSAYPKLKDRLVKERQEHRRQEFSDPALFREEEFLKIFPDPEAYFGNTQRVVGELYRNHAFAQLQNDFPHIDANYLRERLEEHNNHYLSALRAVREAVAACPMFGASRRASQAKFRVPYLTEAHHDRVPLPDEMDELFFREFQYSLYEERINAYLDNRAHARQRRVAEAVEWNDLNICPCCYSEDILSDELVTCFNAASPHAFCRLCVQRHAEQIIGQGRHQVTCLSDECNSDIPLSTLRAILQPRLIDLILHRSQQDEIRQAGMDNMEMCPFCYFAIIMDVPVENDRVLRCQNPECLKQSCRLCQEPNHVPLKCNEVERANETAMRTFVENRMAEALMRTCPKCNKRIIKDDGCNKMWCPCGAYFCYVCRQELKKNDPYSHFNGPGPRRRGNQCSLFTQMSELHEAVAKEAGEKARDEYLASHPELRNDDKKTVDVNQLVDDANANRRGRQPGMARFGHGINFGYCVHGMEGLRQFYRPEAFHRRRHFLERARVGFPAQRAAAAAAAVEQQPLQQVQPVQANMDRAQLEVAMMERGIEHRRQEREEDGERRPLDPTRFLARFEQLDNPDQMELERQRQRQQDVMAMRELWELPDELARGQAQPERPLPLSPTTFGDKISQSMRKLQELQERKLGNDEVRDLREVCRQLEQKYRNDNRTRPAGRIGHGFLDSRRMGGGGGGGTNVNSRKRQADEGSSPPKSKKPTESKESNANGNAESILNEERSMEVTNAQSTALNDPDRVLLEIRQLRKAVRDMSEETCKSHQRNEREKREKVSVDVQERIRARDAVYKRLNETEERALRMGITEEEMKAGDDEERMDNDLTMEDIEESIVEATRIAEERKQEENRIRRETERNQACLERVLVSIQYHNQALRRPVVKEEFVRELIGNVRETVLGPLRQSDFANDMLDHMQNSFNEIERAFGKRSGWTNVPIEEYVPELRNILQAVEEELREMLDNTRARAAGEPTQPRHRHRRIPNYPRQYFDFNRFSMGGACGAPLLLPLAERLRRRLGKTDDNGAKGKESSGNKTGGWSVGGRAADAGKKKISASEMAADQLRRINREIDLLEVNHRLRLDRLRNEMDRIRQERARLTNEENALERERQLLNETLWKRERLNWERNRLRGQYEELTKRRIDDKKSTGTELEKMKQMCASAAYNESTQEETNWNNQWERLLEQLRKLQQRVGRIANKSLQERVNRMELNIERSLGSTISPRRFEEMNNWLGYYKNQIGEAEAQREDPDQPGTSGTNRATRAGANADANTAGASSAERVAMRNLEEISDDDVRVIKTGKPDGTSSGSGVSVKPKPVIKKEPKEERRLVDFNDDEILKYGELTLFQEEETANRSSASNWMPRAIPIDREAQRDTSDTRRHHSMEECIYHDEYTPLVYGYAQGEQQPIRAAPQQREQPAASPAPQNFLQINVNVQPPAGWMGQNQRGQGNQGQQREEEREDDSGPNDVEYW